MNLSKDYLVDIMKGISIPFSFIIFLIILLVIAMMILLWHFSGFGLFEQNIDNVTSGLINNTSGGAIHP